jgi:type III pantothenate kinase
MKLPFKLAYRTPETLGTDRLAAAAAAWLLYGRGESRRVSRGVIALDAGTAFTYEVIDRNGVYQGGTISPGPGLMQRSLNRDTAQLPEVPLSLPDAPIGRSTVEAIQAGIMYGFIESVRGLLNRIDGMLGEDAFVVVTGGWGTLIKEHVSDVDAFEPHLVLEGVRLLMEMNG